MHQSLDLLDRAIHEEVSLVAYNGAWPQLFEAERQRLSALCPWLLQVEHFGSTAIPGMAAKPIIDILAGVESMAVADSLVELILASGYTTSREFNAKLTDRRWFMRAADGKRTHHLHVVELGGAQWQERLLFRDKLRSNKNLSRRYEELKVQLATMHKRDREAYTDAKSQFIAAVVGAA